MLPAPIGTRSAPRETMAASPAHPPHCAGRVVAPKLATPGEIQMPFRFRALVLCLVLTSLAAACGDDAPPPPPPDVDGGGDATVLDARTDGPRIDAPSDTGVDAPAADFGPSAMCAGPAPAPCDGMSRAMCTEWASRVGGRWTEPAAACVQGSLDGCARAEICTDTYDVATCHCGAGPACTAGEVCARERSGDARRCLPCSAD